MPRPSLSALLLLFCMALPSSAQKAATVSERSALSLGAAWYPEQWPESRWDADLQLMQDAGLNVVRITEFAWSRIEPSEGKYDLDWLDRAIRAAERHKIAVVLGTPTAAPPIWLTQTYPDVLRVMDDGRRDQHGGRRQYSFSSEKYRELTAKVVTVMAERYGHDPNVIGWQIDNEYERLSYDDETKHHFQQWLQAHFKTIDALNTQWTTAYWSQTYTDWSQISIPPKYANPGLLLSWQRFIGDTWRSYQKVQLDVLRAHIDKRQWITNNMMGWFDGYDQYTVSQDLDMASWDDYVGKGHLDPIRNGAAHDLTRGLLRKNFWVMETQPGFVNWSTVNNVLDRGETRAMAWHDVGHGADAVLFWQWRSALNGQEEYHGTLVGPDGAPVPVYREVAEIGRDFAKAAPALAGTRVESDVALLYSFESRWATEWQKQNNNFDYVNLLVSYYAPLRQSVRSVDIVSPSAPLSRYKLVVAPALNLLSEAEIANLKRYVQGGGHLVFGPRSVMKDAENALRIERQPGPFATELKGRVEQYYALENNVPLSGTWGSGEATQWAEQLSAQPGTEVLMRYGDSNGWLDGEPAAITRAVGHGRITYLGALMDTETTNKAMRWSLASSGVTAIWPGLPKDVDLSLRTDGHKHVAILINFGPHPETVTLPQAMNDVLEGGKVTTVTLRRYGVAVLTDQ